MSANKHYRQTAMRRIIMLGRVVIGLVVISSAGAIAYMTNQADKAELAQERRVVSKRLDDLAGQMVRNIEGFCARDEAYQALSRQPDLKWADFEVGHYFLSSLQQDAAMLLDSRDRTIKTWTAPRSGLSGQTLAELTDKLRPLVEEIRTQERVNSRVSDLAKQFDLEAVLTRSAVVNLNGQAYLVAAGRVVAERATVRRGPGPAPITMIIRKLDADLVQGSGGDLRLQNLRLGPPTHRHAAAEVPLVDLNGHVENTVTWTPGRPGLKALRDAAPAIILCLTLLAITVFTLVLRIRGIFRELAAGEEALDRTMEALVRAKDQADSASIAKSQFLANMSHEIRTPLNGILGMAQVMARRELSPDQAERLTIIKDSGQSLLTILNDVLDFSKIEAGRLEIDSHEFDVVDAVGTACSTFSPLASQKGVALKLEIEPQARGIWLGDGGRLRQVIANLVSNAVKFTATGEIVIHVEASVLGLRFSVHDTGIGIPQDRIGSLFQKFSQVDSSTTRRFGGTGLGLAISRELVTLMGGWITLVSEEGLGSTFVFELPLQRCIKGPTDHLPAQIPQLGQDGVPVRILAAEDNETNRLILRALFEPMNVSLTVVENGREAVEAVQAKAYDVVLMDVQMPEMNGIEAASTIRAWETQAGRVRTPILALSANVMSHHILEYKKAGMVGTVAKPIEEGKMLIAISKAIDGARAVAEKSAAA
ncbi:MAG: histidine kinase [Phenylobacterium zucineum]|nr:MAG: histidine kinase [Phenylobacterium zucineum]